MAAASGFTLVELLIAIFIFAIVIGVVYGSYRTTFHVVGGTEKQIAATRQAAIAIERFREDVGSMVTGEEGNLSGEKTDDDGLEGFSVSFISALHLQLVRNDNWRGRAKVTYYTKIDEATGLLDLYREDTMLLPETSPGEEEAEPAGYIILKGLKGAKVTYFGSDNESVDAWDMNQDGEQENMFPVLISINLQVASADREEAGWLFRTAVALRSLDSSDAK